MTLDLPAMSSRPPGRTEVSPPLLLGRLYLRLALPPAAGALDEAAQYYPLESFRGSAQSFLHCRNAPSDILFSPLQTNALTTTLQIPSTLVDLPPLHSLTDAANQPYRCCMLFEGFVFVNPNYEIDVITSYTNTKGHVVQPPTQLGSTASLSL